MENNTLFQIIIGLIGFSSQLILLARELFKLVDTSSEIKPDEQKTAARFIPSFKSLLDLSFVILCSAFFSLLTADSLIVSGRNPSSSFTSISYVILITTAYLIIMIFGWYVKSIEKIVGFLSVITLIILVLSPRGPFDYNKVKGAEVGLDVFLALPVIILVSLSSAMLIYSFGNPLSRSFPWGRRVLVSIALTVICIIASVSIGKQVAQFISDNERSPQFSENNEGKSFVRSLSNLNREERRNFYQLASEVVLSDFYQTQYQQVLQNKTKTKTPSIPNLTTGGMTSSITNTATNTATNDKTISDGDFSPNNENANKPISQPITRKVEPSKSDLASEKTKLEIEELEKNYEDKWDRYVRRHDDDDLAEAKSLKRKIDELKQRFTYSDRGDLIVDKFKIGLDINQKFSFLKSRLYWIHPVGWGFTNEPIITLPGLKAEDRLTEIAKYRLVTILSDDEKQREQLFDDSQLSYPDVVKAAYPKESSRLSRFSNSSYESNLEKQKPGSYSKKNLFAALDWNKFDPQTLDALKNQMRLPYRDDCMVVFQEYQDLAKNIVKTKINNPNLNMWIASFENLDYQSQQALYATFVKPNNISTEALVKLLANLNDKNADFGELISSRKAFKVKKLSDQLNAIQPSPNEDFPQLMVSLRTLDKEDSKNLTALLTNAVEKNYLIEYLFSKPTLELVRSIKQDLELKDQKEFLTSIVNPVSYSVNGLLNENLEPNSQNNSAIIKSLSDFGNLIGKDQNAVLHQLAIDFYQPGGEYSFDPISLLIMQATLWNDNAGWLTATFLNLPLLIGFMFLGAYVANLLNKRDRIREILVDENTEFSDMRNTLGTPVELIGREDVINTLKTLAERGWSTIGIVGRRGVGKSRILHALVTDASVVYENSEIKQSNGIRVWVSSPSKFSEEEFILSIYERLALSAERAVAQFLKAKPLSIRIIENKIAVSSSCFYAVAVLVFGIILFYMSNRLSRTDIVVIWIPILALTFSSFCLFFAYLIKLQPINLTSWLQSERSQNPHTYLLYRDIFQVLESLKQRSILSKTQNSTKGLLGLGRFFVLGILSIIVVTMGIIFVINLIGQGITRAIPFAFVSLCISLALWFYYFRKTELKDNNHSMSGESIMSLIVDYRNFASIIVHRLEQGALGLQKSDKFNVLICIDELDKIVDFEEIRIFIRRIKSIFEIPGIYYYISIAEDTLRSLYQGPATGKNEIDSAFDHIVRIPSMSVDNAENIALNYLKKSLSEEELPSRIARLIATLSFGIPRDIIRRSDEVISNIHTRSDEDKAKIKSSDIVKAVRENQIDLGYELHQLSNEQINNLRENTRKCAVYSKNIIAEYIAQIKISGENSTTVLLLSLIWILALIEISVEELAPEKWTETSNNLCNLGYQISDTPLEDLIPKIQKLHDEIVTAK